MVDLRKAFEKEQDISEAPPQQGRGVNTMAIVIDVQNFARMDKDDAKNYTDHLAKSLKALRDKSIPVTWVTMRKGAQLYQPENIAADESPAVREIEELRQMGFDGVNPNIENHEIFRDFILEHGPKSNEVVAVKSLKSALIEEKDVSDKPDKYKDKLEAECGETLSDYFSSSPSLADLMRQQGIQNIILMGAVSSHCVAETAVSAAIKGLNAEVLVDNVLSWQGEESFEDPETSVLLWRGLSRDDRATNTFHSEKISNKIAQIVADQSRGLSHSDLKSIEGVRLTSIDNVKTNLPQLGFTPPPQPSSSHQ